MEEARNLTLVMDFYELTMSQCYYKEHREEEAIFDLFYRKNPDDGGFCIAAGLEQAIEYIRDFHVSKGDIEYLRSLHLFEEDFLEYLSTVRFTGDPARAQS